MGRGSPKYTYYFIKADGRLYVNEWYEYDKYDNHGHGIWYYYGDEGKAASGLTQINGTLYYFRRMADYIKIKLLL